MKIVEKYSEKQSVNERIEIGFAKYIGDYAIRLKFKDGTEKLVDFKLFLNKSQHPSIKKYLKELVLEKIHFLHLPLAAHFQNTVMNFRQYQRQGRM